MAGANSVTEANELGKKNPSAGSGEVSWAFWEANGCGLCSEGVGGEMASGADGCGELAADEDGVAPFEEAGVVAGP